MDILTFWYLKEVKTAGICRIWPPFLYPPQRSCRGVYWFHHVRQSVRLSRQILCRMITWVVFLLKFYQLFTGEERRIPLIFDDFHFCRSRVIGLEMMENRIFTLCRMITWLVFLRMFWNFISSLPVKRGGSLSFLTIFTFAVPELLDLIWRKIGILPYICMSYDNFSSVSQNVLKFYQQLTSEERRVPFIFGRNNL
jgi:hypothetical protein